MEKTIRVGLYARVSTHDQQTLPMQLSAMREYVERRGWTVVTEVSEIGSGAKERAKREQLLRTARRRKIDAIVVWRPDRWGRSLVDLVSTLGELVDPGVGFVSLTETLDLTTLTGPSTPTAGSSSIWIADLISTPGPISETSPSRNLRACRCRRLSLRHGNAKGVTLVFTWRSRRGQETVLYSVGTRELKQHTGEIVERVRKGERVLLTLRGEPVAVISPVDQRAIEEAVELEAQRAEQESLGWLAASENSFSFWDNAEDEVWDEMAEGSANQTRE